MIATERLVLRPLHAADADWIATGISVPAVHRWLTSPPCPYRRADAVAFLGDFADRPWAMAITRDDVPLGVITIERASRFDPDRPDLPELGYWLRRDAWGHGYMSEAARAMVDWHRQTIGGALHSGTIRGNTASQRVLARLGFMPFESVQRHSAFHDRPVTVDRVILHP